MTKTVACLAGDGVGPELMAAATRALDRVAALHHFELDDRHLPFAGEAVTRSGHALPATTRAGYRDADAILVASPHEPAFAGVKADLQLAWRVARVHLDAASELVVVGPVGDWANETALAHAFTCAAARRGRIVCVGDSPEWRDAVRAQEDLWPGLEVEHVSLGDALLRLRDDAASLDVVVTETHLVDALVDSAAAFAGSRASVAHAWLPEEGPGVFAPGRTAPDDVAGFNVVDPMGMLLATSLMLAEGLQRRSASRTLERAVGAAAHASAGHDTRAFTDAVIELLPQSRTDVDHFDEVWR
ncbi:MAG TPA: isocitrate/isopropylmalate family dehydrogenase [Gaiellaceae bacterium]|jgi:3-isopropylmalate dehydrogenase|nr:isocitrate/isopropylmalate family dehydrogenase [Gaiellaceae bacterium]